MPNGDERTVESGNESAEINSGIKKNSDSITGLSDDVLALKDQLEKALSIKDKMAKEQVQKNQKFSQLKEAKTGLESQVLELQQSYTELMEKFESISAAHGKSEERLAIEETRKKAELDALVEAIPEDKRGLLVDGIPVDAQLDYIKKNSKFLLGQEAAASVFAVPNPVVKEPGPVVLTAAEKALIAGKIPEDAALELKAADPNYFDKFKK